MTTQQTKKITLASPENLETITRILNQAIEWGDANAYTHTFRSEDRLNWFHENMQGKFAVYIYKEKGEVLGYLAISPYRAGRESFYYTAEVSYYVDFKHHREGIGSALMQKAFEHCRKHQIKTLLAFLYSHNEKSIKFLRKFGFDQWGFFPETAEVNDKKFHHVVYGKKLN